MSVTKHEDVAKMLRQLADEVESDASEQINFTLEAERFPVLTSERLQEADEAARQGWVKDVTSPSKLIIKFKGTKGII